MADPDKITLRSEVARPLSWSELDDNFNEVKNTISEVNQFYEEYTIFIGDQEQFNNNVSDSISNLGQSVSNLSQSVNNLGDTVSGLSSTVEGFESRIEDLEEAGDFVNPFTEEGSLLIADETALPVEFKIGSAGNFIRSDGTTLEWVNPFVVDVDDIDDERGVVIEWLKYRGIGDVDTLTEGSFNSIARSTGYFVVRVEDFDDGPSAGFTGYLESIESSNGDLLQRVTDAVTGEGYIRIVLGGDFINATWESLGGVAGPSSATNNAVALFDGTSGKVLKNGVVYSTAATANTIAQRNASGGLVVGTLSATGAISCASVSATGNLSAFSDPKLKNFHGVIDNALARIEEMSGYFYQWKADESGTIQAGLNADEVQRALSNAVYENEEGIKEVSIMPLLGLIVSAINELKREVRKNGTT